MKIFQHSDKFLQNRRFAPWLRMMLVASFLAFAQGAHAETAAQKSSIAPLGATPQKNLLELDDGGAADAVSAVARHLPTTAARQTSPPPEPSPLGESLSHGDDDGVGVAMSAFLRMIVVLAGVLLLAYLLLHKGLGKLSSKLTHGRLIRVVDRVGLEPKKVLYVVEVADHHYLIGSSEAGLSHLATLDDAQGHSSFASLLKNDNARKDDKSDSDVTELRLEQSEPVASGTVSEKGAKNA